MPAARPLPALPIDNALPAVRDALASHGSAVLQAPPGAGKTTHVPLALLGEPWLAGRKIVMLEPRRLAARAAARRMAALLGEPVGDLVGYRTRLDTRVGPATRVEVVTEGVLTRMLQRDPGLEDTALLIFDEFHERSIHADAGLALALLSRDLLRPELRLLVMSATLDAAPVADLLGGAPVISSEGRQWPVEIHWVGTPPPRGLEPATAGIVRRALDRDGGDVLVFLPGRAEIHRVERLLLTTVPDNVEVLALFGDLPPAAQDRAIQPSSPGRRKVVLATSIAETSLTIEGVSIVVDAGLSRVPRFSPRTGMSRLETVRVSRAAAEQRAGRAGRLGPGTCYRLWSAAEHAGLVPRHRPEILEADLAPLALDLAAAGVSDPGELRWLDPPPAGALDHARELLRELGAFDAHDRLTPHGRAVARLPMHPRLAHLVLRAEELGLGATGAALAALLDERDVLGGDGPPDADVRRRLELVLARRPPGGEVRRDVLHRVRDTAKRWRRIAASTGGADAGQAGVLLSFAYPDRIGKLRGGAGRYLLRNGRGAWLDPADPLAREPWIVAADISDAGAEGRIHRAAPISIDEIMEHHGDQITPHDEIDWDPHAGRVRGRRLERLGAIVMRETSMSDPAPELVAAVLLGEIAKRGIAALPWSSTAEQFRQRVEFMHRLEPERWPDLSDAALAATLGDWLAPHLTTARGFEDIAALDLSSLMRAQLEWRERTALDEQAPTHVVVPSGSRVPIDYSDPSAPAIDVRLQEMFGAADSPRIAGGRVPLTLRLLSPARRPIQVTRDLAGFWKGSYAEVRKEMRGRYPKHEWPEDPLGAAPTTRAKPRSRG
ncbi:MAG: ATP-dependent helicase HrpB [Gemmatimonadota bacterium]|nr:ATP-dependent helicase HrpB [Gemmatimonadota bacterium]